MDRLPALTLAAILALAAAGCGGGTAPTPATRFDAVRGTGERPDPARWCDVWAGAGGVQLAPPPLVAATPGKAMPAIAWNRWVWLNVWATWCAPCRREMPLLEQWVTRLNEDGDTVELVYLSVDEDADALARFVAETPALAMRTALRLRRPDDLGGWLASLGCEADTAIPVQIIAAPGGKLRCVRSGSLREGDFTLVRAIMER